MKISLILLSLLLSFQVAAAVKIGVVNIQKVITSINEGKTVMKTLEKSFKSKQSQLKKEEGAIKKLQKDYQKQSLVLSEKAKLKKENEIRGKIKSLQQKTMAFQKDIQKQEANLKKPIIEKLKPVIEAVSKAEKVELTFELTTSPIVYAANRVDITKMVIDAYNKKHK